MAGRAGPNLTRLPGRTWAEAAWVAARRELSREWAATPMSRWLIARPWPEGFAVTPNDPRPCDLAAGERILAGRFELAGRVLDTGERGDPWDRPSPDQRFAIALHRMDWMRDLLAVGSTAYAEALRLTLDWSRVFGRWNAFSWTGEVLERRVFNLACAAPVLAEGASDSERDLLALDLARQARRLLSDEGAGPARAAERACAAALAGSALAGRAGQGLMDKGLQRLAQALPAAVLSDGGHATRNARTGLELLLDLRTLDDALHQKGLAAPAEMSGAMDRLSGALRSLTLSDGGLVALQGSATAGRELVAAAEIGSADGAAPGARGGFQRLDGRRLQVIADTAPPAEGPWSLAACAQPLAIEVLAHNRRLITSCGWSTGAPGPGSLRMVDAASTLALAGDECGAPLEGLRARALGPRLLSGYGSVDSRRQEADGGVWLELAHDGWAERHRLRHERRLFLDPQADELRGEDRLTPIGDEAASREDRSFQPYVIRFHLHPRVKASLALDGRSALIRAEDDAIGWRLRSDAPEMAVEESIHFDEGVPRRSQQVVMRGQARTDSGARVRWKLSAAESGPAH